MFSSSDSFGSCLRAAQSRRSYRAKIMSTSAGRAPEPPFNAAELTMLAHLYRGEMYRSKVWRTRLDATTNWAVVTTGVAISVTFSSAGSSPLPLVLVGCWIWCSLPWKPVAIGISTSGAPACA